MPYSDIHGIRLFYDQHGDGRPPLVFVHGYGCSHDDWQAQVDFFRAQHRVVTCDLPGHGASASHPEHCSIESFGADVAALLAALELPPAVLIGHSMGCRVVLQAYLDAPERVAGLILVDGSCVGQDDPRKAEQDMRQHISDVGYTVMVRELFADMFLKGRHEALKQRLINRALTLPEAVGAPLFARLVAWDAGQMGVALSQVRVPLLALQSTYLNPERVRLPLQPGDTTPWTERLHRDVPTSQIQIISEAGHFPMLEVPETVNQAIAAFVAQGGT